MTSSIDSRPRLYCGVSSSAPLLAVPSSFAHTVRPRDLVAVRDDGPTSDFELVRVESIQTILGRGEALLFVTRGVGETLAVAHLPGAVLDPFLGPA